MIKNNYIPQGYKQTELGVIPEDWEIVQLKNMGTFFKGSGISREEAQSGNLPAIRYGEIYTLHNDFIKTIYSHISPSVAKKSWQLTYGDILFACSGETKEEIGKSVAYVGDLVAYAGGDIIILSPDQERYDAKFIGYSTNAPYVVKQKSANGQGDAIVHISKESLANIVLIVPKTIQEQRAIAEALSNVDALIAALDKKIAKKRLIKQGAMQQLLTGKKRLQGFTDKWESVKLRTIIDVNKGEQINKSQLSDYIGYPVMNGGIYSSGFHRQYNCDADTIIISEGGNSCGFVNYMSHRFWAGGHCYIVIPQSNVSIKYLYLLLKANEETIMGLRTGSGLPNIQKNRLLNDIEIYLAPNLEEQQAIAAILSDMDKEIADLEARRNKYKLVKSGIMQKLLTGQIRLVKPLAPIIPLEAPDTKIREIPLQTHIVAGHIVNTLYQSSGWGRTKLQKTLHLVGYHCQLDFGNEYIRNTAGPDDQAMMNHIDSKFKQYRHVKIEAKKDNGKTRYNYIPTEMIDELEQVYETYPQTIRNAVDSLINKIKKMDLARAEIVSTLYAVWNNRIIKGEQISDDLLLADFYAWSKHKSDFSRDFVLRGLNYMRKEGIIPIGWGKYIDKK